MHARRHLAAIAGLALLTWEGTARAGGFYLPDNGTQALGRGAAFVAKADDPTAIYWNPAGLARQRGTQILLNGNLSLHSFEFKRSGTFPDDPNNQATPWGGLPYPAVTNTGGPFFEPFLAASSDFGTFDRLTIGAGVFGPPAVGNRTFPLGVRGAPSASRYDFVQSNSRLLFPTASVAYRITPWLDLGVSGHLVLGSFDQTTITYADAAAGQCANVEYQPCDSRSRLTASGTGVSATIGAMLRPLDNVQFGLSVRTPTAISAAGTLTPTAPSALAVDLAPGSATLTTKLPLEARLGGRYIELDGDFELYDIELDLVYEGWAGAQGTGPEVKVPELGSFKDIDTVSVHKYKNTYGVRLGGAYNMEALDGVLSVRGGAYFDSSATDYAYTRLDFDTLAKVAGTLGVGYKRGAFQFDFAYAAVASLPRVVGTGQGDVRPINGAKNGDTVDAEGNVLPAVNEGAYRGFTNIFSFGVTVTIDELFGGKRPIRYGNPYEPGYVPEGAEPPKKPDADEKKDDKKPDAEEKKPAADDEEKKPAKKPAAEEKKPSKKPAADDEEKKPSKKPAADDEEKKPSKKPAADEKKPDEKKPDEKKPDEKPKKKDWWEDLD